MDIEDRAEKYARDHVPTRLDGKPLEDRLIIQWREILRAAWLLGAAQADYTATGGRGAQDQGWADYWEGKPGFRPGE